MVTKLNWKPASERPKHDLMSGICTVRDQLGEHVFPFPRTCIYVFSEDKFMADGEDINDKVIMWSPLPFPSNV